MNKVDFLRRFSANTAYDEEKNLLPYPSISLTDLEGELWLKGINTKCAVKFVSNAKDGIITIDGIDYPLSNGFRIIYLEKGEHTYTISKGSLKDEYNLQVSPTTLEFEYSGGTKQVSYTAESYTYSASMTRTISVSGTMTETANFTATKTTVPVNWYYDRDLWLTNTLSRFTAELNPNKDPRGPITIEASLGTEKKIITATQKGNGKVVTATTYSVTNISTNSPVEWNVQSATTSYDGITKLWYADGTTSSSTARQSQTVSWGANNTTNDDIPRSGSFTWNEQTVSWTTLQNPNPKKVTSVTYSVSNIVASPSNVAWDTTASTINFDGNKIEHYLDGTSATAETYSLSSGVTFGVNDSTTPASGVTKQGTFNWEPATGVQIPVNWSVTQAARNNDVTATTYSVKSITANPATVEWDGTSSTINYIGVPTYHFRDGSTQVGDDIILSQNVSWTDTNTTTMPITRQGTFNWEPATGVQVPVNWSVTQLAGHTPSGEITYRVENIETRPSLVASNVTTATTYYDGVTITHMKDGHTSESSERLNQVVDCGEENLDVNEKPRSGSFNWTPVAGTNIPVAWSFTQEGHDNPVTAITYEIKNITAEPATVDWSGTTSTIKYDVIPTYYYYAGDPKKGDAIAQTKQVTFTENLTTTATTKTGEFNWTSDEGGNYPVSWSVAQGAHPNNVTSYTYSVSAVSTPSVNYDVTATSITYIGITTAHNYDGTSTSTSENLSNDVTFAVNNTDTRVTRTGSFNWLPSLYIGTQPQVQVNWSVKQGYNPDIKVVMIDYLIDNVTNPRVEWSATTASVDFTGITLTTYESGRQVSNEEPLTVIISIPNPNFLTVENDLDGEVRWQPTEDVLKKAPCVITQGAHPNNVTSYTYNILNLTYPSEVEWDVTSMTVTYTGKTTSIYYDGTTTVSTQPVTTTVELGGTNTTSSPITREGTTYWKPESYTGTTQPQIAVPWSTTQKTNKVVSAITYSVTNVETTTVGPHVTQTPLDYTGVTTYHYMDGTSADIPAGGESLECVANWGEENTTTTTKTRTGTSYWYPEGGSEDTYVYVENVKYYRDSSKDEVPVQKSFQIIDNEWEECTSYSISGYKIYQSTNTGRNSSYTSIVMRFSGYSDLQLFINSYAEATYDYTIAWNVDTDKPTTLPDDTSAKVSTKNVTPSAPTSMTNFTEVNYTTDKGVHTVCVTFRKDSSTNQFDDRGYIAIPLSYFNSSSPSETAYYAYTSVDGNVIYNTGSEYPSSFSTSTLTMRYCSGEAKTMYTASGFIEELKDNHYITIDNVKFYRNGAEDYNNLTVSTHIPVHYYAYTSSDGVTIFTQTTPYTGASGSNVTFYTYNGSFVEEVYQASRVSGPSDLVKVPVNWQVTQRGLTMSIVGYNAAGTQLFSSSTDSINSVSAPEGYKLATTKIAINDTVTSIEDNALSSWTNLASIEMMDGNESNLHTIGDNALSGCRSLTSIPLNDNITSIGTSAFENCVKLTTLNDTNTLSSNNNFKTIESKAFKGCSSLATITIPSNITEIQEQAFSGTSKLGTINLSEGLKTIGASAFTSSMSDVSSGDKTISLPNSVESVGDWAFAYCGKMTTLTLSENNNFTTIPIGCFYACSSVTENNIPTNITTIQDKAFANCYTAKVILNNSGTKLTTIGASAFTSNYVEGSRYNSLSNTYAGQSEMIIPDTVTSMGKYVFAHCTYLPKSKVSKNVEEIPDYAFYSDEKMLASDLQAASNTTLKVIGSWAYGMCQSLDNVVFPQSTQRLKDHAFMYDNSLTSINITSNITVIGDYGYCGGYTEVFSYCPELGAITVDSSNTVYEAVEGACCYKTSHGSCGKYSICFGGYNSEINSTQSNLHIGQYAFEGNISYHLVTKIIPNNVTRIEKYAFADCETLNTVECESWDSSQLIYIGEYAFWNCTSLTTFKNIPSSLTVIDNFAFAHCEALKAFTFYNNLTSIGNSAFEKCYSLGDIDISNSVTTIGSKAFYNCHNSGIIVSIGLNTSSIGQEAFAYCYGVGHVQVNTGNTKYHAYNNMIIETATRTCVAGFACSDFSENDMPTEGPIKIGNYAFEGNIRTSTSAKNFSSAIVSIGQRAFYDCNQLTSAGALSAETIGDYAFGNCTSLSAITFAKITDSGHGTGICSGCTLECLTYNSSNLTTVFRTYCTTKELYLTGTNKYTIEDNCFMNMTTLTRVVVTSSGLNAIGSGAFRGCTNLTTFGGTGIPSGTFRLNSMFAGTIGNYAFYNCIGLVKIEMASSKPTAIGDYVFENCSNIETFTFPSTLTTIGTYAFDSCSKLSSISTTSTATPPTITSNTFRNVASSGTISVPSSTEVAAYTSAANWHSGYLASWTIESNQ